MFINALIQLVAKEKELSVTTMGGAVITGFVTGLDEKWLQMSTTDPLFMSLLRLEALEEIRPTGNTLESLKTISESRKAQISRHSESVVRKAKALVNERVNSRTRRPSWSSSNAVEVPA
jgi:hypothetical protein